MPETIIDKVHIVNWALNDLGLPGNFSIDEETELGGTVESVWPRVVDKTFGLHDWTFCRKTFLLNRKVDAPVTGWTYAFDLPGEKIGDPLKISTDPRCTSPLRDFDLEGLELHCNEGTVYARCRVLLDPQYWDPAFRAAFVVALASALAVPLLSDLDLANDLRALAFGTPSQGGTGGEFGRLIAQNRAAAPMASVSRIETDPLVGARYR